MKAWPSNVETLVGVAARCVKTYADTPAHFQPGARLLDFLGHHLEAGEWFGFYYAMWLKVVGRVAESARVLLKLARTFTREGRTRVKGVAVLKLDAAKGRKGWAAENLRKI